MKPRRLLAVLSATVAALAAAVFFFIWLDVATHRFARASELGERAHQFPPFLPADASQLATASSLDSGAMNCRFEFGDERWMDGLRRAADRRPAGAHFLRGAEWDERLQADVLPEELEAYCFFWPSGTGGWSGHWVRVAVDREHRVAWCWWDGPRVPECDVAG